MKKWEYQNEDALKEEALSIMNAWGEQGWRTVAIVPCVSADRYKVFLEREILEGPEQVPCKGVAGEILEKIRNSGRPLTRKEKNAIIQELGISQKQ